MINVLSRNNILILLSLVVLFFGFVCQIYISNTYGLDILGICVLIRVLNSDSFLSMFDFGISEEVLFENKINFNGFVLRFLIGITVLFIFSINIDYVYAGFRPFRYYLFTMVGASFLLSMNKLYYKKVNDILKIRCLDVIYSILYFCIFLFTIDWRLIFICLTVLNLILFIITFRFDCFVIFNLGTYSFNLYSTVVYYFSSLSSKLEGIIITLIIPSYISVESLGLFDLITKIPKAFKSQLGEFNSAKKFEYLSVLFGKNENYKSANRNAVVVILSLIVFLLNLIYLFYFKVDISIFVISIIISELFIGIFYNYFNISLVKMMFYKDTRVMSVTASLVRSVIFVIFLYSFNYFRDLQRLMFVWYFLYFLYFYFIYRICKIKGLLL